VACGSGRRPCGYPDECHPPLPGLRHPGLLATPLFSIPFVPSSGRGVFRHPQCSAGGASAIVILVRPLAGGLSRRHRGFPGEGLPAKVGSVLHGSGNSRRPPSIRQGSGGFLRSDVGERSDVRQPWLICMQCDLRPEPCWHRSPLHSPTPLLSRCRDETKAILARNLRNLRTGRRGSTYVSGMTRDLFLAITIPDDIAPGEDDPDEVADILVALLNRQRVTTAMAREILASGNVEAVDAAIDVERIMVHAIPSPQWLTPETLARLRAAYAR
jgi:hypothetical protein